MRRLVNDDEEKFTISIVALDSNGEAVPADRIPVTGLELVIDDLKHWAEGSRGAFDPVCC